MIWKLRTEENYFVGKRRRIIAFAWIPTLANHPTKSHDKYIVWLEKYYKNQMLNLNKGYFYWEDLSADICI